MPRVGERALRVLVLSSVFPNPKRPTLGVFVKERMRRAARRCDLVVAAPIPWFPLNGLIRGAQWSGIPPREDQDGLPVYHPRFFCVPRYAKWLDGALYAVSLAPFLARVSKRFPFDVIDAHFAYPDGVAAVVLAKLFRVPVMITLRGSIVRLSRSPLHRPQIRWALEQASKVVAVSESLKTVAVGLGILPSKIRVIPNGVDTTLFHPSNRAAARAACGLPPDRTILLAVGGIYEGKGHHLMLQALAQLVRLRPDLLYVMVGAESAGDRYRNTLDRIIEARSLGNHVRFVGPRPHDELPRWYAAADLFCLATRSEGWANVLLEAIACGVPVVTTQVGGNPEIVRQGHDGLLVPAGDSHTLAAAIQEALGRTWDLPGMVAYAQTLNWERAAENVIEELSRLVPGASQCAPSNLAPDARRRGRL